jgi:uncharacterized protein YhfF
MNVPWRNLETFSFGNTPEMADRLAALVAAGAKRATCWPINDGQQTEIGKQMVVLDGSGNPRAVIETVELTRRRFDEVDLQFALDEGEGDETLEQWRVGHRAYFECEGDFAPDMLLWCERFKLVKVIEA